MADNTSIVPYQPQYIVVPPSKQGGGHTGAIVGSVVALSVIGGIGYLVWYEFIRKKTSPSSNFTFDVTLLTTIVPVQGTVKASVQVTNISTSIQKGVQLRLELWPAQWMTSPVGGSPITVGDLAVGESKTVELDYPLPVSWTGGMTLNAQVVLLPKTVAWGPEENVITVSTEQQTFTIDDVIAVNPQLLQGVIQDATVEVTVTNNTSSSITRQLQLGLKPGPWDGITEHLTTWKEGAITAVTIPPGSYSFELSCPLPVTWSLNHDNSPIAIKIQDQAKSGPIYGEVLEGVKLFTLVSTEAQEYLTIYSEGILGLNGGTWIPVGGKFSYEIPYNNTSAKAISATFIFGLRDQNPGSYYEDNETMVTKTLQPGSGTVTIQSTAPGSTWNGFLLDVRILVSKGANIVVVNDQGETSDKLSDIIFEGDSCVGVGSVVTPGPNAKITNEYANLFIIGGQKQAQVILTVQNIGKAIGMVGIGLDINNILATAYLDAGESTDLEWWVNMPTSGSLNTSVLALHQTDVGNWIVDQTYPFTIIG